MGTLPFGGIRTNVTSPNSQVTFTDFGYTGQRDVTSLGLMDYHARFYDAALGRFIQPDTMIPSPASPQSWNRYSYVSNSPINFSDPTGHMQQVDDGKGQCNLECLEKHNDELRDDKEEEKAANPEFFWESDSTLAKGSVFSSVWFYMNTDAQQYYLSYRAEQSYSNHGYGGAQGTMSTYVDATGNVADYLDFKTGIKIPKQYVGVQVNWRITENGPFLDSATLRNLSSTQVKLDSIYIHSPLHGVKLESSGVWIEPSKMITEPINVRVQDVGTIIDLRINGNGAFQDPILSIPTDLIFR